MRLPYAAFLPWGEASATLRPFIGNPDADVRAVALAAIIGAVRFHRERAPEALRLVRSRRKEQDPVRGAMLGALAGLPPVVWREEHLAELGDIVREALDAADLSHLTATYLERLIVRLLPYHPASSTEWLATLVRERGRVNLGTLERQLSDQDVERLKPALMPVLRSWETREREWQLITAAQSLGRRLRVFDELVELLECVLRHTRTSWVAQQALHLIARHRRPRLEPLLVDLLRQDESCVTLSAVQDYLHRRRQDLLTPFLGRKALRGRFSTGRTRYVLPFRSGFHRWTPTQQERFARTLTELTQDRERDSPTVQMAIQQLAALPTVVPERLIELARAENPKVAIRDAAMRALGGLDAGQGIPTLVRALADERARIAIYALRQALLQMPVAAAVSLLRDVPMQEVTVAKEVVRLLGDLPSEESYRRLLDLDRQNLHRDVRVALLRAFWEHLERTEAWDVLDRGAADADPAVAAGVIRIPAERLSAEAQRRLVALLARLLEHADPSVRLQTLQRCVALPLTDSERRLLPAFLRLVESPLPAESEAAASAVFATYSGRHAGPVAAAVGVLLPNRRALQSVLQALRSALARDRGALVPAAREVVEVMARDPLLVTYRVELALGALPWPEAVALLRGLAASGELHAEALMTGVNTLGGIRTRPDVAGLTAFEAELSMEADERLRRLGLAALLALVAPPRGWTPERLARLRAYREDPSPLVAGAAQFTLPNAELAADATE